MKERVVKRLRGLRNWELFDVVLFLGVFGLYWRQSPAPGDWWLRVYAFGIICFILVQGGLYWHLKLVSVERRPYRLPPWFGRLYRRFKLSNQLLLGLYPVLALLLQALGLTSWADLLWSLPLIVFAGLEYVNYYHYQLMHDTLNDLAYLVRHRRLRPAPLASDLVREASRAQGG